jgi:hypothetical protein
MSQASQNTKQLPPPKEKAAFGSEEEFLRYIAEHSAADQKCRADCQSFEALANEMIRQLEELLQKTHLDKKQLAPLASKLLNRANEIGSLLLSMEQTKPSAPRQIPAGQKGNPYLMLLDTY